jgi:hypothetical protein
MAESPKTNKGKAKEPKVKPKDYLANLGYALELINSDPSLQEWIKRVRQYMDKNKGRTPTSYELEKMKEGIDWFEKFNADQEEARMLQADPRRRADWERSLELKRQKVRNIATSYGIEISDDFIDTLAIDARLDQLNDQEIRDRMRPSMMGDAALVGASQDVERQLVQWASRNGLTLSGDTVRKYVMNIAEGKQSIETAYDDLRKTYLIGQYPAWADRILQGFDPADIASPYKSKMAALLEVDEDSIDLSDTLLQRAMEGVGADGKPRVTPLYEFEREIRNDERWQYTDNAKATYSNMGDQILKMFGFR